MFSWLFGIKTLTLESVSNLFGLVFVISLPHNSFHFYDTFYMRLLLSVLLLSFVCQAQTLENYENLRLSGDLTKDFTTSTSVKFERDQKKVSKENEKSIQKAEKRFYEVSHYKVGELLLSGKVLVNDPITNYVNKVADELLKDDPTLRKKIRIYTVKNPSVNAFTTNDGIILINWGLLSKLENEAQLAFILSHELMHFTEEHVIDNFIEAEKIEQGVGVYRRQSDLDRFTARTNYSKELESEADIKGFEVFLNSNYKLNAAIGAFNVLAYAHTPFANKVFDLSFFDVDTNFVLAADTLFLPDIQEPEAHEDEDSDTHPALSDRKIKMESLIEKHDDTQRKEYLVSQTAFKQIQNQARFELSKLFLYRTSYEYGIYHTYLLLQDAPNNLYLHKNMLKALYGIAKFKNNMDGKEKEEDDDGFDFDSTITEDDEDDAIRGQINQVLHLFEEISDVEATVLALVQAWKYQEKYTKEDIEVNRIVHDLIQELVVEHNWKRDSFRKRTFDKDSKRATFDLNFIPADKTLNTTLSTTLKSKSKIKRERKELSDEAYSDIRQKIRKEGYNLGIKKMVAVSPFYLKIDARGKYPLDYLASEEARIDLSERIKENAKLLDMNVNILNPRQLSKRSSDKLEDIAFLNSWMSERLGYGSLDMVSIDYSRVQELIKKYGTEHFYWSGAVNLKERNNHGLFSYYYLACLGPFALTILPTMLGPNKTTYYYSMLFDLEEEDLLIYDYNIVQLKDNNATLNSNIYYNLLQISSKRKKR